MCRPHCWQYANPTGVGVPQRGHVIICCAPGFGADPDALDGGIMPGAVDGGTLTGGAPYGAGPLGGGVIWGDDCPYGEAPYGCGEAPGGYAAVGGITVGEDATIPIAPPDGGGIIGAPPCGGMPAGGTIGPAGAPPPGSVAGLAASAAPHARQNFIPGGFSPRQTPQITGNPAAAGGVWTNGGAAGAADNELPQLRQNDDPAGLSWPHIEQRIGPLDLNRRRVSQVLPAI